MTGTVLAYGWRRTTADLAPLGAAKVYVDWDAKRRDRADLLRDLRQGDVVRVLFLTDLSGSGAQNARWREKIEAKGATVEEARPVEPPKRMGRPPKLDPDASTEARLRDVWLDPARSLEDKLAGVRDILGHDVTRQTLYRRFGTPERPKPTKEPKV